MKAQHTRQHNRQTRRQAIRAFSDLRKDKDWGEWIEKDISSYRGTAKAPRGVYRFVHNNLYSVQFICKKTSWGNITHLLLRRNDEKPDIPWSHRQRIKNELVGEEFDAIEILPAESRLVDQANIYHVFVLPEGFEIPFGLHIPGWSDS